MTPSLLYLHRTLQEVPKCHNPNECGQETHTEEGGRQTDRQAGRQRQRDTYKAREGREREGGLGVGGLTDWLLFRTHGYRSEIGISPFLQSVSSKTTIYPRRIK